MPAVSGQSPAGPVRTGRTTTQRPRFQQALPPGRGSRCGAASSVVVDASFMTSAMTSAPFGRLTRLLSR
jgi:hypothetical protein